MEEIMKCVMCENNKILKSRRITIKYKECGLDNVTLIGLEGFKCSLCGEEYFSYGDQEKLHTLIAQALITKKSRLKADEIRFLRTYLGYSGSYFAKLTGYSKEAVSRFENNKTNPSLSFDRLVRSLVANKLPDRQYNLHDMWLSQKGPSMKRIEINSQKGKWHLANLAA